MKKFITVVGLMAFIGLAPGALAAGTTIQLDATPGEIAPSTSSEIAVKLCTDTIVSTIQVIVNFGSSNAPFSAVTKGDTTSLQFVIEEKYDATTKEAKIVGGKSNGITMGADGCAKIGTITVTPSAVGMVNAKVDFGAEKTQALGGGNDFINHNDTPSKEKKSEVEVTVKAVVANPPAGQQPPSNGQGQTPAVPGNFQAEPSECSATECAVVLRWNAGDATVSGYKIYHMTKANYTANPGALTQQSPINIAGREMNSYVLAGLGQLTEYVVTITAQSANASTSDPANPMIFKTKEFTRPASTETPAAGTTTNNDSDTITTPTTQTPQPAPYVQGQANVGGFTHAASGPEHVVIALLSVILCSWMYLRKKLA